MYVCPGLLRRIHRSNYEKYIGLLRRIHRSTTTFTEEYIGNDSLPTLTTKNTSVTRCILRCKPLQTYTTDGFFGKYRFYVLVSFRVPYKGVILNLQNSKNASSKRDLKNTLPVLVDHFDRCFSHTTGEGLQLWFWSLIGIFLTVGTLTNWLC